jgi:hypothetical protein
MSEEQVATAIAVLKAYVDGTLRTDQCDELDEMVIKAYQVLGRDQPEKEYYSNFGYSGEHDDE